MFEFLKNKKENKKEIKTLSLESEGELIQISKEIEIFEKEIRGMIEYSSMPREQLLPILLQREMVHVNKSLNKIIEILEKK